MRFQVVNDNNGTPSFDDEIARINIILGTNGSGKSKLLDAIHQSATSEDSDGFKVVRVKASRRGDLPKQIATQTNVGKLYDDFDDEIIEEYAGASFEAQGRMMEALSHFSTSLASEQVEYRKRHLAWMATDGMLEKPKPPEKRNAEVHLDKLLSLFSEIFPEISIRAKDFQYNEKSNVNNMTQIKQGSGHRAKTVGFSLELDKLKDVQITGHYSFSLECNKGGNTFPPSNLSDGEKQILTLLADRYFFKTAKCLFLVDEPELNLDPVLAIKYWNLLEREIPASSFIYATHSLDFALRDNVDRIWSIGQGKAQQIPLETLATLPAEEQRRFLSGIRGIITTNRGLVVEGKESSFDAKFYPWILGDQANEYRISYYDGCHDVRAATKKLDIWQEMVPTVTILGIVDADYRAQEELDQLGGTNCLCLDLHDAESYLCHPELLVALAKELKRQPFPTEETLVDEICKFVEETMVEICHHRMAQRCSAEVAVSLRKKELEQVSTFDELTDKVCQSAIKQAGAGLDFSEDHVKSILNEERRNCVQAKGANDVNRMLNLVKGKKLVERFAKHFGLNNSLELMDYVSTNLSPAAFEHTRTLREKIESHFEPVVCSDGESMTVVPHSAHPTPPTPTETNAVNKPESAPSTEG